MIIIMRPNASNEVMKRVTNLIESRGLIARLSRGFQVTIVGVVGNKTELLDANIEISEGVDKIVIIVESYKLVNKEFRPEDSVTLVGDTRIGPGTMTMITSSCAAESLDQLLETAYAMKKAGTTFLCGGAYKPRTSLYLFQGLEEKGFKYTKAAGEATGLNVIYEVASAHAIESAVERVDMLQIGARNIQNFELLKEAGRSGTPVLLERGLCITIDEWLNAVEYIIPEGNPNTVLCKHGIRTYEASVRNALGISAVPVVRQKSHLPVIVDPSYATDVRTYVEPLVKAAIAVGVGGLMVRVHPRLAEVLSDDLQSLTFDTFEQPMKGLAPYTELSGQTFKAQ